MKLKHYISFLLALTTLSFWFVFVANAIPILPVGLGGTGTSTAPSAGNILIGNTGGTYDLITSSTLVTNAGGGGSGAISTSSAISTNNFPFWSTVGGALSGTSTVTTNAGHITFAASNATTSVCGTGPSNVGSDHAGTITIGTGVVTACTLTFGATFAATPACTVAINSVAITADVQSVSQTAVTFGFSASVAGGSLYYLCF